MNRNQETHIKMARHPKFAELLADATDFVDDTIRKIKTKLDHGEDLTPAELMNAHTNFYNLCLMCPTNQNTLLVRHFFDKYESAVKDRISVKVIPSLESKEGNALVRELAEAWTVHKKFTKDLVFIFLCLENRLFLSPDEPLPVPDVSLTCFCDMVWDQFHSTIEKAIRDLIASGWVHEEKPDLPSYTQLSEFVERIDRTKNVGLLN